MTSLAMRLLERDLVPDFLNRRLIRALLAGRLREEDQRDPQLQRNRLVAFVRKLAASPVAIETAAANEQHYEVPTDFYARVLGKHLKYSSTYYAHPNAKPACWRSPASGRGSPTANAYSSSAAAGVR